MEELDEFRDCARDVMAMVEAFLLSSHGASAEQVNLGIENYRALTACADLDGCLRVAVSLVAAAWRIASGAQARVNGTSEDEELSRIMSLVRYSIENSG